MVVLATWTGVFCHPHDDHNPNEEWIDEVGPFRAFSDDHSGLEGVHFVLRGDSGVSGGRQQRRPGFVRPLRAPVCLCR